MSFSQQFDRVYSSNAGQEILPELVDLALSAENRDDFLSKSVRQIGVSFPSSATLLVQGVKGTWRKLVDSDVQTSLPIDLLAEVLDKDCADSGDGWVAAPLEVPNKNGWVLIQQNSSKAQLTDLDAIASALHVAHVLFRERRQPIQRVQRLSAMLDMTARWQSIT